MMIMDECPSTRIFECMSNGAQGDERCLKCVMYVLSERMRILEILQKQGISDTAWRHEVRHDLLKGVMLPVGIKKLQTRKIK